MTKIIILILIEKVVNMTDFNKYIHKSLKHAFDFKHPQIVEFLLERLDNNENENNKLYSSIISASIIGYSNIVKILLCRGVKKCSIKCKNKNIDDINNKWLVTMGITVLEALCVYNYFDLEIFKDLYEFSNDGYDDGYDDVI